MKIQSVYETIGKYGCLALNYLWIADISYDKLAEHFNDLLAKKIIDEQCTVKSASDFLHYFGVSATVEKSAEAPTDGSRYIGRWVKGNFGHFVGMQNGKVVNNTLDFSHCVSEGKLDSDNPFRIVKIQR